MSRLESIDGRDPELALPFTPVIPLMDDRPSSRQSAISVSNASNSRPPSPASPPTAHQQGRQRRQRSSAERDTSSSTSVDQRQPEKPAPAPSFWRHLTTQSSSCVFAVHAPPEIDRSSFADNELGEDEYAAACKKRLENFTTHELVGLDDAAAAPFTNVSDGGITWSLYRTPTSFHTISLASDGHSKWAVDYQNTVFAYQKIPMSSFSDWVRLDDGLPMKQVAVGNKTSVWGITIDDPETGVQVVARTGFTDDHPSGSKWTVVRNVEDEQELLLTGIDKSSTVPPKSRASFSSPSAAAAALTTTHVPPPAFKHLSVAIDGSVWALDQQGTVYFRVGASTGCLGYKWIPIQDESFDPTPMKHIAHSSRYNLYGVREKDGKLMRRVGICNDKEQWTGLFWQEIVIDDALVLSGDGNDGTGGYSSSVPLERIAASADGSLWGITAAASSTVATASGAVPPPLPEHLSYKGAMILNLTPCRLRSLSWPGRRTQLTHAQQQALFASGGGEQGEQVQQEDEVAVGVEQEELAAAAQIERHCDTHEMAEVFEDLIDFVATTSKRNETEEEKDTAIEGGEQQRSTNSGELLDQFFPKKTLRLETRTILDMSLLHPIFDQDVLPVEILRLVAVDPSMRAVTLDVTTDVLLPRHMIRLTYRIFDRQGDKSIPAALCDVNVSITTVENMMHNAKKSTSSNTKRSALPHCTLLKGYPNPLQRFGVCLEKDLLDQERLLMNATLAASSSPSFFASSSSVSGGGSVVLPIDFSLIPHAPLTSYTAKAVAKRPYRQFVLETTMNVLRKQRPVTMTLQGHAEGRAGAYYIAADLPLSTRFAESPHAGNIAELAFIDIALRNLISGVRNDGNRVLSLKLVFANFETTGTFTPSSPASNNNLSQSFGTTASRGVAEVNLQPGFNLVLECEGAATASTSPSSAISTLFGNYVVFSASINQAALMMVAPSPSPAPLPLGNSTIRGKAHQRHQPPSTAQQEPEMVFTTAMIAHKMNLFPHNAASQLALCGTVGKVTVSATNVNTQISLAMDGELQFTTDEDQYHRDGVEPPAWSNNRLPRAMRSFGTIRFDEKAEQLHKQKLAGKVSSASGYTTPGSARSPARSRSDSVGMGPRERSSSLGGPLPVSGRRLSGSGLMQHDIPTNNAATSSAVIGIFEGDCSYNDAQKINKNSLLGLMVNQVSCLVCVHEADNATADNFSIDGALQVGQRGYPMGSIVVGHRNNVAVTAPAGQPFGDALSLREVLLPLFQFPKTTNDQEGHAAASSSTTSSVSSETPKILLPSHREVSWTQIIEFLDGIRLEDGLVQHHEEHRVKGFSFSSSAGSFFRHDAEITAVVKTLFNPMIAVPTSSSPGEDHKEPPTGTERNIGRGYNKMSQEELDEERKSRSASSTPRNGVTPGRTGGSTSGKESPSPEDDSSSALVAIEANLTTPVYFGCNSLGVEAALMGSGDHNDRGPSFRIEIGKHHRYGKHHESTIQFTKDVEPAQQGEQFASYYHRHNPNPMLLLNDLNVDENGEAGDPNDYTFLSTYSPHEVQIDGKTFKTAEHYIQAMKFEPHSPEDFAYVCSLPTPKEAAEVVKDQSRARVRPDWNDVREEITVKAIRSKFTQHEDLCLKLIDTFDSVIQFVFHSATPSAAEKFWGINPDTNVGQNMMGRILMEIRQELHATHHNLWRLRPRDTVLSFLGASSRIRKASFGVAKETMSAPLLQDKQLDSLHLEAKLTLTAGANNFPVYTAALSADTRLMTTSSSSSAVFGGIANNGPSSDAALATITAPYSTAHQLGSHPLVVEGVFKETEKIEKELKTQLLSKSKSQLRELPTLKKAAEAQVAQNSRALGVALKDRMNAKQTAVDIKAAVSELNKETTALKHEIDQLHDTVGSLQRKGTLKPHKQEWYAIEQAQIESQIGQLQKQLDAAAAKSLVLTSSKLSQRECETVGSSSSVTTLAVSQDGTEQQHKTLSTSTTALAGASLSVSKSAASRDASTRNLATVEALEDVIDNQVTKKNTSPRETATGGGWKLDTVKLRGVFSSNEDDEPSTLYIDFTMIAYSGASNSSKAHVVRVDLLVDAACGKHLDALCDAESFNKIVLPQVVRQLGEITVLKDSHEVVDHVDVNKDQQSTMGDSDAIQAKKDAALFVYGRL